LGRGESEKARRIGKKVPFRHLFYREGGPRPAELDDRSRYRVTTCAKHLFSGPAGQILTYLFFGDEETIREPNPAIYRSRLMNVNFRNPRHFARPIAVAVVATFAFFASPAVAQDDAGDKSSDTPSEMKDQDGEGKRGKFKGRNGRGMPGEGQKGGEGKSPEGKEGMPRRPGKGGPPQGNGNPGERLMQMFTQIDKDSNGTIDKTEAPERMLDRFDQIDTSGDGQIDRDEVQAMIEKMAERMRQGQQGGMPGDNPPPGGKRKRGDSPKGKKGNDESPGGGSVDPVRPGSDDGGSDSSDS
jgi:uncharacterized low-complexity protein